jgi:hypothetical protein
MSSQTHTKLANPNNAMIANHHGLTAASSSYDPNTSTTEGHTKHRPTAASTRRTRRPSIGGPDRMHLET